MDVDKSGDVSTSELAAFYGYQVNADGTVAQLSESELDDDQILEMLKMAAHLSVAPTLSNKPKEVVKIDRVKTINLKALSDESLERQLLEECSMGDIARCTALLETMIEKKATVRVECDQGQMPLHKLARYGDKPKADALVRKLLEAGDPKVDLIYPDISGKTPLHLAAETSQQHLFKMLLERSANPMTTTNTGWNALHSAVHSTCTPLVAMFLESDKVKSKKKELINTPDNQGRTPLHIAAFRADEVMVKILIDHGANAKVSDNSGNNPATLAGKSNRRKSRELLEAVSA